LEYTLKRSKRRTLAIHVHPNGTVEVRAPLRLSVREIELFIAAKSDWISQKQVQFAARPVPVLPPLQYADGEFEATARDLVAKWEPRLGVATTFVGFREMSTRWGSCTAKTRRIRLNSALCRAPRECLEYVIVHELAHIREANHSPRFWAIVAQALPDYRERQAKLHQYSAALQSR